MIVQRMTRVLGLGALVLLGCRTPALAEGGSALTFREPPAATEPGAPLPDRFDPDWTVQIEPWLWFVGPSGKFSLPVSSGSGPGSFTSEGDKLRLNDLGLASTRISPAGALTFVTGKWRFAFFGSEYSLSRDDQIAAVGGRLGSVAFAAGDRLKLDFSFGTYEVTAGYRVWDYDFTARSEHPERAVDAILTLHLLGGVRIYDLDIGVESTGSSFARSEGSHVFAEPIIGVRAEAQFNRDFSLIAQLSAGGMVLYSTSSVSLDISLAFQWRPVANVGVQIGWRQIAFDLQDGKDLDRFEYTGRLAGLFVGVVIRF